MNQELKRRWIFSFEDFSGSDGYISNDGESVGEDTAREKPFVGTLSEANIEADRRGDKWENAHDGVLSKITSNSLGVVN